MQSNRNSKKAISSRIFFHQQASQFYEDLSARLAENPDHALVETHTRTFEESGHEVVYATLEFSFGRHVRRKARELADFFKKKFGG